MGKAQSRRRRSPQRSATPSRSGDTARAGILIVLDKEPYSPLHEYAQSACRRVRPSCTIEIVKTSRKMMTEIAAPRPSCGLFENATENKYSPRVRAEFNGPPPDPTKRNTGWNILNESMVLSNSTTSVIGSSKGQVT